MKLSESLPLMTSSPNLCPVITDITSLSSCPFFLKCRIKRQVARNVAECVYGLLTAGGRGGGGS